MPSCDVRQDTLESEALFLCNQSMFRRITFGSKRASKLIIVRYSDVLETLVTNFVEELRLIVSWKSV